MAGSDVVTAITSAGADSGDLAAKGWGEGDHRARIGGYGIAASILHGDR